MKALNAAGAPPLHPLPGGDALSAEKVDLLRDTATLLDVRPPEGFAKTHLPGAINIGAGRACRYGLGDRSSIAASLLEHAGYTDVRSMNGGMGAWVRAGFPVE